MNVSDPQSGGNRKRRKDWRLSENEKYDAREALEMLVGSKLSLTDCVRIATSGLAVVSETTGLMDGIEGFMRHNHAKYKRGSLRIRTLEWYRQVLINFESQFTDYNLDDFNRKDLKKWFEARKQSPESIKGTYRAVRAMFRWAARQDPPLVKIDPTAGLQLDLGRHARRIETLSPELAHALIEHGGAHKYVYALGLYVGLRPEEITGIGKEKLDWSAINKTERLIRITEHISKTGRARILEGLSDRLWDILSTGPLTGPINPTESRQSINRAKQILGLLKWPQDCLRHSFATYDLAMHNDVGRTSLLLGHEGRTSLLFTRYRGVRTKAEAVDYFRLV